jgi:hypothetical protein
MMPMDPMSQYDPATEALIAQQTLPRQRVAQAMMGQQGGGMGSLSQGLMQLGMMQGKKPPYNPNAHPYDPVMGTGAGGPPMRDPVMGTGYVSPMTQQMRGRGI